MTPGENIFLVNFDLRGRKKRRGNEKNDTHGERERKREQKGPKGAPSD